MTTMSAAARWWHWLCPRRGGLARRSDRIEAAVLASTLLLGLTVLPFAAAAGSTVYAHERDVSAQQRATGRPAVAMLLADGPVAETAGRGGVVAEKAPTAAMWTLPDGTPRRGQVDAATGTVAGARVAIWLDRNGDPVDPPLTTAGAAVTGIAAGTGLLVIAWSLLAAVYVVNRWALDRARYAAWQREWLHDQQRREKR
ncbi:Rv1733c family protein [Amycolatopsis samaneae]|uniref:Transmembrane protein n=1 Tax=Amycolatopsis samaneae TaxID=664691 RepID=A0ABW5GX66_9PSEU